eukprot:s2761_g6.t1
MEVITWRRALSEDEMWTSMEYLNWKLQETFQVHPAAQSSMVAWFKSQDANPLWKSAVGIWQGRVTKGSITRKFEAGSGATRPVTYLAGDSNAGYDFGKIMKPDFTICSITRYLEGGVITWNRGLSEDEMWTSMEFWKPPDREQEAFMGEIPAQGSLKMLTFPGHVWHFRSGVDQSSALLYVQEIFDGQPEQVFYLGGEDPGGTPAEL